MLRLSFWIMLGLLLPEVRHDLYPFFGNHDLLIECFVAAFGFLFLRWMDAAAAAGKRFEVVDMMGVVSVVVLSLLNPLPRFILGFSFGIPFLTSGVWHAFFVKSDAPAGIP
jgi:hypothetical protein